MEEGESEHLMKDEVNRRKLDKEIEREGKREQVYTSAKEHSETYIKHTHI